MQRTTIDDGIPKTLLQVCRLASSVDDCIVQHQNFIMDKPASMYHHLTERNEGCSRTIVFTYGIDIVSKFPWIAANASNHIVGMITEVATDQNKMHPSRNGTAAQFLGCCVRVDQMLLIYKAKAGLVC
jgi:hypothetical protein